MSLREWGGVKAALDRGEPVNPYWVEWVRQTGGGYPWQFMLWLQARWSEFEPDRQLRSYRHQDFREWLVTG